MPKTSIDMRFIMDSAGVGTLRSIMLGLCLSSAALAQQDLTGGNSADLPTPAQRIPTQQYAPQSGQQYVPPSGQQYAPPSGGQQYVPPSGQQYAPPSGQQYAPPSGQQYAPYETQNSSPLALPSVPQTGPQARLPLQGQVEESALLNPGFQYRSAPYSQTPPGLYQQDPFAIQNQPEQPRYGALPAAPPDPRTQNLNAMVQVLRALQGQQNRMLQGQQAQMGAPPPVRPNWLPGYAFTNDFMVAPYHNLDIASWDKSKIPPQKKWIKLSESVTKFWRGFRPEPCMVLLLPLAEAPGNFSFSSSSQQGPRGWLQDTGMTNQMGFPLYRYWFDRPAQSF